MSEPIISVSGLRGVMGDSLTPEIAVRYVRAFAAGLPPGPLLVARDGRASGPELSAALIEGLLTIGRDVINADVAATPTVGVLVRQFRAAGGVQITASHNPPEYNGLKLFNSVGRVLPVTEGQGVLERYRTARIAQPPSANQGRRLPCPDILDRHLSLVLSTVDVERIKRRNFSVFVDSNHGSGGAMARRLLDVLGCRVTILGESPDGCFAHPPEPTAENLATVLARVSDANADVGFCQDPDADRLAVIDDLGRYIGEEYTLAICAEHVVAAHPGPLVTNCSTSRMTEDVARKFGVPFFRAAVGEANVVDAMLHHHAVFGGEGNGGVIDPRVGLVRDSFVGMALVLDALAGREATIGRLIAEIPRYEIVKSKMSVPRENIAAALVALECRFPDAIVDRLDGVRFDWPGKWLLVRSSNTEPIVRAIAEAPTAAEAKALCDSAAEAIQS